MLKVEKQIKIIIDGEDAQTLSDVCELARREIGRYTRNIPDYTEEQTYKIECFIEYIFDNT